MAFRNLVALSILVCGVARSGPFLSTGTHPYAGEDRSLTRVLDAFAKSPEPESAQRLLGDFLKQYPQSRWRAAMLVSLGSSFRASGRYTKALDSFEEAWSLTGTGNSENERNIANWALGELLAMHSHLGHAARLRQLIAAAEQRDVHGPATEQLTGARESLWLKQHDAEMSARCGPLALASIAAAMGAGEETRKMLLAAPATADGMSLATLESLAKTAGMKMIAAHRERGAHIVVPSVVHWKVDHYSAILKRRVEDGHEYFLTENPLFEKQMWVSRQTLDEETSGYYLAPAGALPSGWRLVSQTEAGTVWGKCFNGTLDPLQTVALADTLPILCTSPRGMARYQFQTFLTSLHVTDEPLGYTPGVGPEVRFRLTYNQREATQPATFSFSNLGPKWMFDWISYVTDHGQISGQVTVNPRGGGQEVYIQENRTSVPGQLYTYYFNHDYQSHAQLVASATLTALINYQRLLPDGSKEIFALVQNDMATGSRRIFLTQIIDPAGNVVKLNYDSQFRLVSVTDAVGQVTTLTYGLAGDPLKLTKVTDPYGRSAMLTYDSSSPSHLASITDPAGITSKFTYVSKDFMSSLTTPYGTTTFSAGVAPGRDPTAGTPNPANRSLEAVDPLGGTEHLEFHFYDPTQSGVFGSSLYWDKLAWAAAPGDPASAKLINWMINGTLSIGLRRYQQSPVESQINYSFVTPNGQPTHDGTQFGADFIGMPARVARKLDDGSDQASSAQYNVWGKPVQVTDPAGRSRSLSYDDSGLDLLEVHNTSDHNATLARFTYNGQHLPLTYTDASGQTTTYTYNAQGKLLTVTDARKETTAFTYDGQGRLMRITGPATGATSTFTYDKAGRVQSVTDSEGYKVSYEYDALDRLTKTTYPDGTSEQIAYNNLDPVQYIDRQGRMTQVAYDALRHPVTITDPLGNVTSLGWCNCGQLTRMTDPNGNITSWTRDLAGRVTGKTWPDGSSATYSYAPLSGRLQSVTDANGQTTSFQYAPDDSVTQITFANGSGPITFTYDPAYKRVTSMQDGLGSTTYTYTPAGKPGALRIAAVSGPLDNSAIAYSYDEIGRPLARTVNGAASSWSYDPLGRLVSLSNALGMWSATYAGSSGRMTSLTYPNGQQAVLSYFPHNGDDRLQEIRNIAGGQSVLSQFDYTYAAAGEIQSWIRQSSSMPSAQTWGFTYDQASRLTGTIPNDSSLSDYAYTYDAAGNRTSEQTNGALTNASFNNLNQLASLQQSDGSNAVTFAYDANGNMLGDGTRSFEWDGLDRLTAVNSGTHRSEFSYDGFSHLVRIVEIEAGMVVDTKQLSWCGNAICEERDTVTGITKRFFTMGETQVSGGTETPYYYTRDHLGSIREITDAGGNVVAAYDYDPFGRMTTLAGGQPSFGYAGYYTHAPSGLLLTRFRAYDPNLGRWLSRDPLGEIAGANLYGYVSNLPVGATDPTGLLDFSTLWNDWLAYLLAQGKGGGKGGGGDGKFSFTLDLNLPIFGGGGGKGGGGGGGGDDGGKLTFKFGGDKSPFELDLDVPLDPAKLLKTLGSIAKFLGNFFTHPILVLERLLNAAGLSCPASNPTAPVSAPGNPLGPVAAPDPGPATITSTDPAPQTAPQAGQIN